MFSSFRFRIKSVTDILFFGLLVFLLCLSTELHAQGGAGVSIKPAVVDQILDPSSVFSEQLTITNPGSEDVTYYLFVRNVESIDDNGVPVFAVNNFEPTGMEVADWINLSANSVVVPAGGAASVPYTINVPENATPGSHIGGMFVSVNPPEISTIGAAVAYQVVSNIIITVPGEVVEEANIRQFSTSNFFYGTQDVDFTVRVENLGNVIVRPTGPLEIYNMLGKKVTTLTVNEERRLALPFSERTFGNIIWKGDEIGFGRYEAIVSLSYGEMGSKKTISSTATFWILPMHIIGPAVLALVVLLATVFFFVKLYIRRSIEQMNHGRKLINRRRKKGQSVVLLLTVVMLTTTALFLLVMLVLFA
jgi:hypothetical protein